MSEYIDSLREKILEEIDNCKDKNSEILGNGHDDSGKISYALVPLETLKGISKVLEFGATKYAPNSWRDVPAGVDGKTNLTRNLDSAMRHLISFLRENEEVDEETNLSHLYHAATRLLFSIYFYERDGYKFWTDEKNEL